MPLDTEHLYGLNVFPTLFTIHSKSQNPYNAFVYNLRILDYQLDIFPNVIDMDCFL